MNCNIADINSDHSQVLRIDCNAPMTTEHTTEAPMITEQTTETPMTAEQTTEEIKTSDPPQSSPQTPVSENSITNISNIDSTTTATTTNVKDQSITTTTDTTTGNIIATSALSHGMLKLKLHMKY